LFLPHHRFPTAQYRALLLCTLHDSIQLCRHPGLRRGRLREHCQQPGSCCVTFQAPRPRRGAMEQWRDDVDRLLGMTHSTSTRSRPRSSRCQHEALASVRSPSVRGTQTNDLRAELNRRRAGEDARVSLERARERRQNIEGCNLDQDFAAVAPQAPMGTRSQAGVPLVGVGCAALADHLHATSWPPKF
jgi:hypothetical protein